MSKSFRIKANPGEDDGYIKVNVGLEQNFDFLEILSLKISQTEEYQNYCAEYGVVAGRIIINNGFGVPNVKVSIFVPVEDGDADNPVINDIYPYSSPTSDQKNSQGIRYNLLPNQQQTFDHTPVGTFPEKREILDNNTTLEIYEKYYKYTTTTNESGDYVLFGIPVGQHTLHWDMDISDIGFLSARPYEMMSQGYAEGLFDTRFKFKSSNNLDSLPQIFTQNLPISIEPYWCDSISVGNILGINRKDISIDEIELIPQAIFFGSIFSDDEKDSVNKKCNPDRDMGEMKEVITNSGKMEAITRTVDGAIVTHPLPGDSIDENGNWSFLLPMTIRKVITDEFGNLVPSPDGKKGVATEGDYRFKLSFDPADTDKRLRERAKFLVPNLTNNYNFRTYSYNQLKESTDFKINKQLSTLTQDTAYSADTTNQYNYLEDFYTFRWKKVYTVKQYIGRYQKLPFDEARSFIGIKDIFNGRGVNKFPSNRIDTSVHILYIVICSLLSFFAHLVGFVNGILMIINGLITLICNIGIPCGLSARALKGGVIESTANAQVMMSNSCGFSGTKWMNLVYNNKWNKTYIDKDCKPLYWSPACFDAKTICDDVNQVHSCTSDLKNCFNNNRTEAFVPQTVNTGPYNYSPIRWLTSKLLYYYRSYDQTSTYGAWWGKQLGVIAYSSQQGRKCSNNNNTRCYWDGGSSSNPNIKAIIPWCSPSSVGTITQTGIPGYPPSPITKIPWKCFRRDNFHGTSLGFNWYQHSYFYASCPSTANCPQHGPPITLPDGTVNATHRGKASCGYGATCGASDCDCYIMYHHGLIRHLNGAYSPVWFRVFFHNNTSWYNSPHGGGINNCKKCTLASGCVEGEFKFLGSCWRFNKRCLFGRWLCKRCRDYDQDIHNCCDGCGSYLPRGKSSSIKYQLKQRCNCQEPDKYNQIECCRSCCLKIPLIHLKCADEDKDIAPTIIKTPFASDQCNLTYVKPLCCNENCGGPQTPVIKDYVSCVMEPVAVWLRMVKFDFYNDWVNGSLYFPLIKRKRIVKKFGKKRGLLKKDKFCDYHCIVRDYSKTTVNPLNESPWTPNIFNGGFPNIPWKDLDIFQGQKYFNMYRVKIKKTSPFWQAVNLDINGCKAKIRGSIATPWFGYDGSNQVDDLDNAARTLVINGRDQDKERCKITFDNYNDLATVFNSLSNVTVNPTTPAWAIYSWEKKVSGRHGKPTYIETNDQGYGTWTNVGGHAHHKNICPQWSYLVERSEYFKTSLDCITSQNVAKVDAWMSQSDEDMQEEQLCGGSVCVGAVNFDVCPMEGDRCEICPTQCCVPDCGTNGVKACNWWCPCEESLFLANTTVNDYIIWEIPDYKANIKHGIITSFSDELFYTSYMSESDPSYNALEYKANFMLPVTITELGSSVYCDIDEAPFIMDKLTPTTFQVSYETLRYKFAGGTTGPVGPDSTWTKTIRKLEDKDGSLNLRAYAEFSCVATVCTNISASVNQSQIGVSMIDTNDIGIEIGNCFLRFEHDAETREYFCKRFHGFKADNNNNIGVWYQRPGSLQFENSYQVYPEIKLTEGVNLEYLTPDGTPGGNPVPSTYNDEEFFIPGDGCGYDRTKDTTADSNVYYGNAQYRDWFYGLAPGVTSGLINYPNNFPSKTIDFPGSTAHPDNIDAISYPGVDSYGNEVIYEENNNGSEDMYAIKFNRSQTPYYFFFGIVPGKTALHKTVGKFFADKINSVTLRGIGQTSDTVFENINNQNNINNTVKNPYSIYKSCLGETTISAKSGLLGGTGTDTLPVVDPWVPPDEVSEDTTTGIDTGEACKKYIIHWRYVNNGVIPSATLTYQGCEGEQGEVGEVKTTTFVDPALANNGATAPVVICSIIPPESSKVSTVPFGSPDLHISATGEDCTDADTTQVPGYVGNNWWDMGYNGPGYTITINEIGNTAVNLEGPIRRDWIKDGNAGHILKNYYGTIEVTDAPVNLKLRLYGGTDFEDVNNPGMGKWAMEKCDGYWGYPTYIATLWINNVGTNALNPTLVYGNDCGMFGDANGQQRMLGSPNLQFGCQDGVDGSNNDCGCSLPWEAWGPQWDGPGYWMVPSPYQASPNAPNTSDGEITIGLFKNGTYNFEMRFMPTSYNFYFEPNPDPIFIDDGYMELS